MDTQERKLKERIERRKEKVQRLIEEQEAYLATMDSAIFKRRQDYFQALSAGQKKLYRLKQELLVLESGPAAAGYLKSLQRCELARVYTERFSRKAIY